MYSDEIIDICNKMGLIVSNFDRKYEPEEIRHVEGMTTVWGIEYAISKVDRIPNVICDLGDVGKEKLIMIFSDSVREIVDNVIHIAENIK